MDECDHTETGCAHAILALVVAESGVEYEQWLVPVQYAAQVPYHLLLG